MLPLFFRPLAPFSSSLSSSGGARRCTWWRKRMATAACESGRPVTENFLEIAAPSSDNLTAMLPCSQRVRAITKA